MKSNDKITLADLFLVIDSTALPYGWKQELKALFRNLKVKKR